MALFSLLTFFNFLVLLSTDGAYGIGDISKVSHEQVSATALIALLAVPASLALVAHGEALQLQSLKLHELIKLANHEEREYIARCEEQNRNT